MPTTFEELDDPLKPVTSADIYPRARISDGRGLKLSWPHAGDARRSQVGNSSVGPGHGPQNCHVNHPHMVHVSSRDIAMHYYQFTGLESESGRPVLEVPLPWNPISELVEHEELFEYCKTASSFVNLVLTPD